MKREKRRISLRRRICEGGNSSALYRSIGKPERGVWENTRMKKERGGLSEHLLMSITGEPRIIILLASLCSEQRLTN